jgi:hypothetical protein
MVFIPTTLYEVDYEVKPDEFDEGMAYVILNDWNSHFSHSPDLPRVGDYVIMPDGSYERAAYVWPEGIQTCKSGSFHIGIGGASMSGSLNPVIPNKKFKILSEERKEGAFWFFHHGNQCASNAVGLKTGCRVFRVI